MADAGGPEEWYRSLPKITRGYLTASFAATLVAQLELVLLELAHACPVLGVLGALHRLVVNARAQPVGATLDRKSAERPAKRFSSSSFP